MSKKRRQTAEGTRPDMLQGRGIEYTTARLADIVVDPAIALRSCDEERANRMAERIRSTGGRVIQPLIVASIEGREGLQLVDGAGRYCGAVIAAGGRYEGDRGDGMANPMGFAGTSAGDTEVPVAYVGDWKRSQIGALGRFARTLSAMLSLAEKPSQTLLLATIQDMLQDGWTIEDAANQLGVSVSAAKQIERTQRLPTRVLELADEGKLGVQFVRDLATQCGAGAKDRISVEEAVAVAEAIAEAAEVDETTGEVTPAPSAKRTELKKKVLGKRADFKPNTKKAPKPGAKPRTFAEVREFFADADKSKRFAPVTILKIMDDRAYSNGDE
jgi:transcriptional regulator with XRE-family HTH domain